MLRLILFRHGKSSWDDPACDDFSRPLAPRGLRSVPEMGRRLARRRELPELIVSSTALRAISTARAVAREIGYREDGILEAPDLYLASPDAILAVIRQTPASAHTLMIIGHNPGLTDFANMFEDVRLDDMPTAGMLCAEFDAQDWSSIDPARAHFAWYDYPKKQPG